MRTLMILGLLALGGTARAAPGPELVVQTGHSDRVHAVAFSADGRLLASAAGDNSAKVWDVATGKELRVFWHDSAVGAAIFSLDARRLITGASGDEATVWDLESGARIRKLAGAESLALSADGRRLFAGSYHNEGWIYDLDTGRELTRLRSLHDRGVYEFAMTRDLTRLFTASEDDTARMWSVEGGKPLAVYSDHGKHVRTVALSPDDKLLATGGDDGKIRIREIASGKVTCTLAYATPGNWASDLRVRFTSDGKRLASAQNREVAVWDLPRCALSRRWVAHADHEILGLALSPDGSLLATASRDKSVKLWDLATGRLLRALERRVAVVATQAFSPDSRYLVTGIHDLDGPGYMTSVWDLAQGKRIRTFAPATGRVAMNGERQIVVTHGFVDGAEDREGAVFDVDRGAPVRRIPGGVGAIGYSRDASLLVTAAGQLIDVKTAAVLRTLRAPDAPEYHLAAFSGDRSTLALATRDPASIRIYNAATGALIKDLGPLEWKVDSIALSTNGRLLASGEGLGTARIRELPSGKQLREIAFDRDVLDPIYPIAFGAGDAQLVTVVGKIVKQWSVSSGALVHTLEGHQHWISSLAVSADGRWLSTSSRDGTVKLWDARTGRLLVSMVGIDRDDWVVTTPDGYYFASRGGTRGVAFRVGGRAFPFEQFDLKLNRPDLVLERIGASPKELIEAYRRAYEKRLRRMGFDEQKLGSEFDLPEVRVPVPPPLSTDRRQISLKVEATAARSTIDRLNVFVDEVPIFGSAGQRVEGGKRSLAREVPIELSSGKNRIQISVHDARGLESLRQTFEVVFTGKPVAPRLFALAIGVSRYRDSAYDLTYAAKDASDLGSLLARPGRYAATKIQLLSDEKVTRDEVLAARKVLEGAGVDDVVVLFVAGHGLLDEKLDYYFATTDVDFTDPAKRGLGYTELEGLLDGLRARKKLLLMDTCHSGEIDKEEVARADATTPEGKVKARAVGARGLKKKGAALGAAGSHGVIEELFADLRRGSGTIVISSAGGAEFALESEAWKNGVFTYSILEGLESRKADKDGDGATTVGELRDHVIQSVQRLTGGQQTPTSRRENLEHDFRIY